MNVRAGRFPLFDSLRAIAVLCVAVFHTAAYAGGLESDFALRQYVTRLDVGVTIFFLISGFLLYRPFVRARWRGEAAPATGAYAWRRFLRIVPAYWLALTLVTLMLGVGGVFTVSGMPTFYGFGQIYGYTTALGGISQAWSICVEVTFYAFLPLYALLIRTLIGDRRRLGLELLAATALLVLSLAYKLWLVSTGEHLRPGPGLLSLPAFLDLFAVGMALAAVSVWLEDRREAPRAVRMLDRFPSLGWLLALAAFWLASTRTGAVGEAPSGGQYIARHLLFAVVALGVILPGVFGDPGRGLVRRVLSNRVLLYIGLVSYGIYLYHPALLVQLDRFGFSPAAGAYPGWLAAGVGAAVLIASASYYAVERPLLRLKRLLPPPAEAARGEALAESAPAAVPRPG